jgi:hypothetical protein
MKPRPPFHPPNLTASALAEIAGVESRRAGKRQPREPTPDTNTGRRRCGSGELRRKCHCSDNTVSFWFKTTAENTRLCAAKRYTRYHNRWSHHVITTVVPSASDGTVTLDEVRVLSHASARAVK